MIDLLNALPQSTQPWPTPYTADYVDLINDLREELRPLNIQVSADGLFSRRTPEDLTNPDDLDLIRDVFQALAQADLDPISYEVIIAPDQGDGSITHYLKVHRLY